ncbi:hypothetical protein SPFL3102_03204 [Sporomusaceae bacterium FL31]|nr:hypothetical protein SPFL3101_03856 [Sporomusaceae bacterium FL31]GCE35368.1 hypothetical protein SPFL3102_03204 [Sporomusaceae bacterium]
MSQINNTSSNRYKAVVTLGITMAGLLVSFPFQSNFWGGLLTSACQAAVVGGLADWFAVTALFRKPLGIPFRTAIVPRNREKIFMAITEMVQVELLSKESIKKTLDNYDISEVLLHFLDEHDGRRYLREIVYKFVHKFIEQVKPDELGSIIADLLRQYLEDTEVAPLVIDSSEWLIKNNYDESIVNFAINQLEQISEQRQFKNLLADLFLEARNSYERNLERRRVFNNLFQLSQQQVAEDVQKALLEFLGAVKENEHPLRNRLKERLTQLIDDLKTDVELQRQIETWKDKQLTGKLDLAAYCTDFITVWQNDAIERGEQAAWLRVLTAQLNQFIDEFAANPARRANFDYQSKALIGEWLDQNHNEIGRLVAASLQKMSDDMLVGFIEDKVGNDLQMIRINGSVVGGLVGILIYLLTFWW